MGGRVGDALAIVDWLVSHDVHATTFMTGAMADNQYTDAGREVLGIIDALPGLLTLGNHSYTHRDFRTLSALGDPGRAAPHRGRDRAVLLAERTALLPTAERRL